MSDWKRLGRLLASRRGRLGMTQQDLAKRAGVGSATVQAYERGDEYKRIPRGWRQVAVAVGWVAEELEEVLEGAEPTLVDKHLTHSRDGDRDRLREVLDVALGPDGVIDPEITRIVGSSLSRAKKIELVRMHIQRLEDARRLTRADLQRAEEEA